MPVTDVTPDPRPSSEEARMRYLRRSEPLGKVRDLRTVGIVLGPYRNLTTLTVSVLSLHPECQVLNHAGERTLTAKRDFIADTSQAKFRDFCAAALEASESGKRGKYGGSILLSHAFDDEQLRQLYHARYGDSVLKERPRCLVWKEPQWITERIRQTPDTISRLVEILPETRFLLPVRDPFACAKSNLKTGHARRIKRIEQTPSGVLEWILENAAWFAGLAKQYPERFLMFYEDDPASEIADGLIECLELEDDQQWRAAVDVAFDVRTVPYEHEPEMYATFQRSVDRWYADLPKVAERMKAIVGGQHGKRGT